MKRGRRMSTASLSRSAFKLVQMKDIRSRRGEWRMEVSTLIVCVLLATLKDQVSAGGLWGKKVDFMQKNCRHWLLKPEHSIPALSELSVCVDIKIKINNSDWTAFMYLHPDHKQQELVLRGHWSNLYIIMFGRVWISRSKELSMESWHSICLTWSRSWIEPKLYINGTTVVLEAQAVEPAQAPGCCSLASGGTLTLAAAHSFVDNNLDIESGTELKGSLSLFRVWRRARSSDEILNITCTDGDTLHWESRIWNASSDCQPVADDMLQCEWPFYEVKVVIVVSREDGNKTTESEARNITEKWLNKVLNKDKIRLHRLSVSSLRSSKGDSENSFKMRDLPPGTSRFDCLAHLDVNPRTDVGKVQDELTGVLSNAFTEDQYKLITSPQYIFIYPLDNLEPDLTTIRPALTEHQSTEESTTTTEPITTPLTTTLPPLTTVTESSLTLITETAQATSCQFSTPSPEALISDSFFKIIIKVTINGSNENPVVIIESWLTQALATEEILVLNFQYFNSSPYIETESKDIVTSSLDPNGKRTLPFTRHQCAFQAKVTTASQTEETQKKIQNLLETPYTDGHITLVARPKDIWISHIDPGQCPKHRHLTRQGLFIWNRTLPEFTTSQPCVGNPEQTAYRKCVLDATSDKAVWRSPDLRQCQVVVTSVADLKNITVTSENAEDILIMIEDFLHEKYPLSESELSTVLEKMKDAINVSTVSPQLGEVIINITSDILESDTNLKPFTNSILNITEAVGDQMIDFSGQSVSLQAPALAISVVNIDPGSFHNLTFGVSSTNSGSYPEIYINQHPFDGTVAFVSLPSEIQDRFPINEHNSPRVQFQFYAIPTLFQTKDDPDGAKLNTYVVSASITNATGAIQNLKEHVAVTLHHLSTKTVDQGVQCVYWDFNKNGGFGGWSPKGCWTYNSSNDYTTCLCDHLTHFGVLLDVSRTPIDEKNSQILTVITYMGCGVSSCFLGITVLTYTLLEKLRRDYPSKILLNLSIALLGVNLLFLLNSWISSFGIQGLCVAVAAALHYFLLTSFTWMGLGAVNMYFALVKVFNVYVPSYILKFCLIGWGIPLIICGLVLSIKIEAYGATTTNGSHTALDDSDMFCWVQDDVVFYVTVMSYIAFVLLCNMSIFLVVLIQIRHMHTNQPAGTRNDILKDLRAVASLTFLLGITWSVAFLAWGPVKVFLLYVFSILNSFQGFFIFVFHCLMKENVRNQWRIHLCCGVLKLQKNSEGSHTATADSKAKPNSPAKFPFMASVRSIKSNSTQTSSVSSESSQGQVSFSRPDFGNDFAYENSLVLPRARSGFSSLPHDGLLSAGSVEFNSRQLKN